ncbi:MAG: hypothetical protein JXA57_13235, partial [Armatimonadetes bacterium]|nr:hypothetical protein [Armatimonadota bacterium]
MAGGSKRVAGAHRKAGTPAEGQSGQTGRSAGNDGRSAPLVDRLLIAVVTTLTVVLLAISRYALDPTGPLGWSWPLLLLCILVTAIAGRALLGKRRGDTEEDRPPRRTSVALWALLLAAAILPNLRTLSVGFLADDFGLLRAAALADTPL